MDARTLAKKYRDHGFTPFPLSVRAKEPQAGVSLYDIDRVGTFEPRSNIGLFAGSPNGLVVVDADSDQARKKVTERLEEMGLYDFTTIVRTPKRGGNHFWLRVKGVPEWAKKYYKLNPVVGDGELRLKKPSYVVAPGSRIPQGEYKFVQGGIEYFIEQPMIKWEDLEWLVSPLALAISKNTHGLQKDSSSLLSLPFDVEYRSYPRCLSLLRYLKEAERGDGIPKINILNGHYTGGVYGSRSEAEAALVMGLILSGWSFDEIEAKFDDEQPKHYAEHPRKEHYLISTYNSAVRFLAAKWDKQAA